MQKMQHLSIPFFSAVLITMILFFIDEGYYDFRWMLSWGNWIVFGIYIILLFPVQWLISRFLFVNFIGWKKALLMFFVGIPLTMVCFYFLVM